MNNDTFDFEKEHPELYAEVQARKAQQKRAERVAVLLSIVAVALIALVLNRYGVSLVEHSLIVLWTSFTSIFTLRPICESYVK